MIHWLMRLFRKTHIAPSSNNKNPSAVNFAFAQDGRGRTFEPSRGTGRRDPTRRTTVPTLVNQPITIKNENGNITIEPLERDLFEGEQVKWICSELAWEIRFDQPDSNTPFSSDVFGPGLIPPPVDPDTNPDLPPDEVPGELTGPFRDDTAEGSYGYTAQVGNFGPLTARIKIFRRPRS